MLDLEASPDRLDLNHTLQQFKEACFCSCALGSMCSACGSREAI
jgi:hypothetical protein